MRIGIACYPTYGGPGVVASELGIELAKRGHEIHIISFALPFRLKEYFERVYYHEVEVSHYPLFKYPPVTLSAACKMIDIADSQRLDILHVHYAVPWAVSAHLAREVLEQNGHRLKIVTTLHGTDITLVGSEPSFFKMTRFGIQCSDALTAVSKYLELETRKIFEIKSPIEVIHNFVDVERFKPRAKESRCTRRSLAPAGERVLIHVSNFRPVKNIPDLIQIFSLVRKMIKCRLVMVGEGPELPAARRLASELGLEHDVIFMGAQPAVEEILTCADVFLLPSAFESFGLSALEAMSCGLPVVGTDNGGMSEYITSGVEGWLCRPGDISGMAERVHGILAHDAEREAMSAAARKKALDFMPEKIVNQYEALYERTLNSHE